MSAARGRLFCNTLCPVGALLGLDFVRTALGGGVLGVEGVWLVFDTT